MSGLSVGKDRHGNDFHFGNAGNFRIFPSLYVNDYWARVNQMRHLELRDGDVIMVSFPRSGTSWNLLIVNMLMTGTIDYEARLTENHMEWCSEENFTRRPENAPRLYSTHVRSQFLPRQVKEKKVKVIYCYRNPKDNWVSLYNLSQSIKTDPGYEGTWSNFFDLMMDSKFIRGDWFDHILDYENYSITNPDLIFPSCYELLKKDPVGQILKIDEFLGLHRGRQLCEQIAEACEFSVMKPVKEALFPELGKQYWKDGFAFYRKGEIGDWKNWFTVAQSEQLDAVFKKRMSGSKLPFYFQ